MRSLPPEYCGISVIASSSPRLRPNWPDTSRVEVSEYSGSPVTIRSHAIQMQRRGDDEQRVPDEHAAAA